MDPVDWQQRYLNHDTPWDKGRCHPLTLQALDHFVPGDILVPGCGHGWDARELRDATNDTQIIGIDISPSALEKAQHLHGHSRLHWLHADLFAPSTQDRLTTVKNIWEHTCLCALPPTMRADYINTLAAILPSGGMLCGVFFTHMDDGDAGPPWNTPHDLLQQLYSPLFELLSIKPAQESFPGREGEESFVVMRRTINEQTI